MSKPIYSAELQILLAKKYLSGEGSFRVSARKALEVSFPFHTGVSWLRVSAAVRFSPRLFVPSQVCS